jgi:hypothetical protein
MGSKLAESPFFWLAAFSGGALAALVAIGPKFQPRQRQIEANYQMRERVYGPGAVRPQPGEAASEQRGEAAETPSDAAPDPPPAYDADAPLARGLGPLKWTTGSVLAVSLVLLAAQLARDRKAAGRPRPT